MRRWFGRRATALCLGLLLPAGAARAQQPAHLVPAPPPILTEPSYAPTQSLPAPTSVPAAPPSLSYYTGPLPGSAAPPAAPYGNPGCAGCGTGGPKAGARPPHILPHVLPETRQCFRNWAVGEFCGDCGPDGCRSPLGCGTYDTERIALFGSCRQFFGCYTSPGCGERPYPPPVGPWRPKPPPVPPPTAPVYPVLPPGSVPLEYPASPLPVLPPPVFPQ